MNAKELVDALEKAKVALWRYLSTEENTYLPLDVYDFREEKWTGDPTSSGLAWMWNENSNGWEYKDVDVQAVVYKDGLTFVWYNDGESLNWAVFDDEKAQRKPL